MDRMHRFTPTAVALGLIAFTHAMVTWSLSATVALFVGGAAIAFVAEATVVSLNWLEHHTHPTALGVPLSLLAAWPGTVYISFRLSLMVTDSPHAVVLAAAVATCYDALTDHLGVAAGHWSYMDDLPGPRPRGVPWWNFVGWFLVSGATAALAVPFL